MGHFRDFICLFLVAFVAHTCMAETETTKQVNSLRTEIDELIEAKKTFAEEYRAGLKTLSEDFTSNVTDNIAELTEAENEFIDSIKERVGLLDAAAKRYGADISKCTDDAFYVISIVKGVVQDGVRCIREDVKYANKQGQPLLAGIDSSIDILVGFQKAADICIARFDASSQSTSEAAAALACVKQLRNAASLWGSRIECMVDISAVKSLFDVHKTRVTKCASISLVNLSDLTVPTDRMIDDIVSCAIKKAPKIKQDL